MAGKPTYEELEQRIIELGQEVAGRKQLEETLTRNQQFLAEAEKSGHIGSWELDVKTNNFTLSGGAFHIFGVRPGEFQPSYDDFLSRVYPDDRDKVKAVITDTIGEQRGFASR